MWFFPTTCWNNDSETDDSDDCSGCSDSGAVTPLEAAHHLREQWRGVPAARAVTYSAAPEAPLGPRRPQWRAATPLQPLWLSNTYVHSYLFLLRTRRRPCQALLVLSVAAICKITVGPTDKEQVVCCFVDAANNASAISVFTFGFSFFWLMFWVTHSIVTRADARMILFIRCNPTEFPNFASQLSQFVSTLRQILLNCDSAGMQIIHAEPRESEEAAEIVRGLGWLLHNDQLEAGSFAGMCDTALGAGAQFHRRQFNRTVCVHGEVPVGMIALGIVGPGANAAKFCGRRITPDAIYVLTHEMKACCMRPQIICSRFPASRTKPLIAHCKHSHKLPSAASCIPARCRCLRSSCRHCAACSTKPACHRHCLIMSW